MNQGCDRRRDDLGAYVLGALDDADRDAMRQHLTTCATCHDEYEYLLPIRDRLASARRHLLACRACQASYEDLLSSSP
jgi:anti-sigma factor RsiW